MFRRVFVERRNTCLIPLAIFWVVWRERNRRVFEGLEDNFDRVRDR